MELKITMPVDEMSRMMIAGLDSGRFTHNGDRVSDYYGIAEGDVDGLEVVAALIENKVNLDESEWFYSLHVINDVDGLDCQLCDTKSMSEKSLCQTLKEILAEVIKS